MSLTQEKKEISLYSPQLIGLMRAVHEKGGVFRFKARGCSMSPFIRDGDILTIAKSSNEYNVGEIVAFVRPCFQKLVVHRIVGKKMDKYLIKGDNTSEKDGSVPLQNLLGRVVRVERVGRDVFAGIGIERGFIAWLSCSNLFFVLFFFPRLLLKIKKTIENYITPLPKGEGKEEKNKCQV